MKGLRSDIGASKEIQNRLDLCNLLLFASSQNPENPCRQSSKFEQLSSEQTGQPKIDYNFEKLGNFIFKELRAQLEGTVYT